MPEIPEQCQLISRKIFNQTEFYCSVLKKILILARILNKKENIENNKLNKNENIKKWKFLFKFLKFDFKSSSIFILKVKCVLFFAAFLNPILVRNIFSQMFCFRNILTVLFTLYNLIPWIFKIKKIIQLTLVFTLVH